MGFDRRYTVTYSDERPALSTSVAATPLTQPANQSSDHGPVLILPSNSPKEPGVRVLSAGQRRHIPTRSHTAIYAGLCSKPALYLQKGRPKHYHDHDLIL